MQSADQISGHVSAFLRIGTDLTDNYYEVENTGLIQTQKGQSLDTEIWPMENEFDIEFELLLKEKRHKELIKLLSKILTNLETDSISKSIELSINKLLDKSINDDLPSSISSIGKIIIDKLEELKNPKPQEWKFKIIRDNAGYISELIGNRK
jgi:cell surface protein SprA